MGIVGDFVVRSKSDPYVEDAECPFCASNKIVFTGRQLGIYMVKCESCGKIYDINEYNYED